MKWLTNLFHSLGFSRGLVFVTIANFVSIGLGGLLWFILAAQMTAVSYGSLNYYISIAIICHVIGIMGFDTTLTTFLPKGLTRMLTESSSLVLIAGSVISIILSLIFKSPPLVLAFMGSLFFAFSQSEMLGKHFYKEFMILSIVQRLLTLVLVPLLFISSGVNGALYGYAISYLPLCYRFFNSTRKFDLSLSTLRPNKKFIFHSYALGVSKYFMFFSDKLIIMPLFGLGILGYYQFGIQVLLAISVIPVIVYNYLLPEEASGKNRDIRILGIFCIFSSVILTTIMIVLMPMLITKLFPNFEYAILSTQIISLAGIPLSIVALFNSFFMAREKSFYVIIASGIFLITQYSLIYTLGSAYGLVGLSTATVIASIAQTLYLLVMKRRVLPASKIIKR
jgi:O-antigen/teichoic acid export membrane protein